MGVKTKKTKKSMKIPVLAPASMNLDQGDTRSNAFGGPSFIVRARRGPNVIVRMENACTDLTNLGIIFRITSPLDCGESFASEGLIETRNVRAAPVHPITEATWNQVMMPTRIWSTIFMNLKQG